MDTTLFKENLNKMYNNLHKMIEHGLKEMIKENNNEPLETEGAIVDGVEILTISEVEGKIYCSGDYYEYELNELTADEIFEVVMGLAE